jgi:hypothetical protein
VRPVFYAATVAGLAAFAVYGVFRRHSQAKPRSLLVDHLVGLRRPLPRWWILG